DELKYSAPKDHDILIQAFDLTVTNVRYAKPHTFHFSGYNSDGHATAIVCHFTQLIARVVFLPKRGRNREITGFSSGTSA
ncbi:MAG TPA: hypothetical protein VGK40_09755, partial [Verrucomicrobiae bacterium]